MKLYTVQKVASAQFIKNPYVIILRAEGTYSNHKIEYLGDFLDPNFNPGSDQLFENSLKELYNNLQDVAVFEDNSGFL